MGMFGGRIFQRIKGVLLVLFGTVLLLGVFLALHYKVVNARSFAEFLPQDDVLAFVEGTLDANTEEYVSQVDRRRFFEDILGVHPLNIRTEAEQWVGSQGGFALMQPDIHVYFVSVQDPVKAQQFLEGRDKGHRYLVAQVGGYVVASEDAYVLSEIVDNEKSALPKLANDADFLRVKHNLSPFRIGFFYLKQGYGSELLFPDAHEALKPFLTLFTGVGGNVTVGRTGLFVQTYTGIHKELLSNPALFHVNKKYRAALTRIVPRDGMIAFFGGHDLVRQFGRMSEIFDDLYDSLMHSPWMQYVASSDVDFGVVVALLGNEYALSVHGTLADPAYLMTLALDDVTTDRMHLENLEAAFVAIGAVFAPEERAFELPDGSKGRELVANPENVYVNDIPYEAYNVTVREVSVHGTPFALFYVFVDDVLLLATQLELLENALAAYHAGAGGNALWYSRDYREAIRQVIGASDELYIVQAPELTAFAPFLERFLGPFTTLTSAKNYFDDGISTIHFLSL